MTTNDMTAIMNPKENFRAKTYNEEKGNKYEMIYARAEAVARVLRTQVSTDGEAEHKQNAAVTLTIPANANILSEAVRTHLAELHQYADAVSYRATEDSVSITFTVANLWQE